MVLTTFYFQLHQPYRLNPEFRKNPGEEPFLWNTKNEEIFHKVAEKNYIPATRMLAKLIEEYPQFKITMSISGTLLEQAAEFYTKEHDVIAELQELFEAGQKHSQVEFMAETYYHSIASLFNDPKKEEFTDQIHAHTELMKKYFGISPTSFRNTELFYNNDIAEIVADMGYRAMLCEYRPDMDENPNLPPEHENRKNRNQEVFRAKDTNMIVLPRHRELSDVVAYRFGRHPISAQEYTENLSKLAGKIFLFGVDYEHIGEHIWANQNAYDIFDFYNELPAALAKHKNIVMANPTEIAKRFKDVECPVIDINYYSTSSWADKKRDTFGWLGSDMQKELFWDMERLSPLAKKADGKVPEHFRYVSTSCHLHNIFGGSGPDAEVHDYFSAHDNPADAARTLGFAIDYIRLAIDYPNIIK